MIRRFSLLWICIALLAAFLVWPILLTLSGGFMETGSDGAKSWTTRYLFTVFADPVSRQSLINSVFVATAATALCFVLALPLASLSHRYTFAGRGALEALILVPLILPPFVGAIGLRHLLGRAGSINAALSSLGWIDPNDPFDFLGGARFLGVVIIEALHLYPIIYLNATAALANLDPALDQTAQVLGAGRWTRYRRITLPLIRPGLFAGGTIVFIWSFTELGTPLMFDYYKVAPVQVYWGLQEVTANPQPYALVVVLLAIAVGLYALGKLVLGVQSYPMTTRAMTASETRKVSGFAAIPVIAPFILVLGLAILPHMAVVLASFTSPGSWYQSVLPKDWTADHYANALTHPLASGSIQNSLLYSSLALVVDIVLGFGIAYLLARTKLPGRRLLDALVMLPLAVPGIVLAFGYVAMTLRWPFPQLSLWFQQNGWTELSKMCQVTGQNPDPTVFLVIMYAVRRLPYIVRSTVAGLEQTAGDLEDAAANLGAPPRTIMRRVVIPLIMANLIAGGLLAFSFAMLAVSESLVLAQKESTFPMTKAIYALFTRLGDGPYIASAMGVWGMVLMTLTLVSAAMLMGRKLGAVFRI